MLWWEVVRRRGRTGWQAALLAWKRCPLARDACDTLTTDEKRESSANITRGGQRAKK